jgi:hypothetical protein
VKTLVKNIRIPIEIVEPLKIQAVKKNTNFAQHIIEILTDHVNLKK